MTIKLYVEGINIDLYPDENIQYTSKITDTEKLDAVFNDSTNTFTIPATSKTNKVFKDWFEIGVQGGFNPKNRVDGYLEFNTIPYKFGQVQLEGINYQNGLPKDYKITFYGTLLKLSDRFGEDKLRDITQLDQYSYDNTLSNFLKSIYYQQQVNEGDTMTPLIAITDRNITYGTGFSGDVSEPSTPLKGGGLRPSLRVSRILEAIQDRYGVTFNSEILNSPQFKNLFLWLNGKEQTDNANLSWIPYTWNNFVGNDPSNGFDLKGDNQTIEVKKSSGYSNTHPVPLASPADLHRWNVGFHLNIKQLGATPYKVRVRQSNNESIVYEDENFTSSQNRSETVYIGFNFYPNNADFDYQDEYIVEIMTKDIGYFTVDLRVRSYYITLSPGNVNAIETFNVESNNVSNDIVSKVNILDNLPDMTVSDFFKGIMKAFKLLIRPVSETEFNLFTLDEYYRKGNVVNLTDYVDLESHETLQRQYYKEVNFKYQESDLVLQKNFRDTNRRNYGEYTYTEPDLGNVEVKDVELPFTNLMLTRLRNTKNSQLMDITVGLMQEINTSSDTGLTASNEGIFLFYNNGIADLGEDSVYVEFAGTSVPLRFVPIIGNTDSHVLQQVNGSLYWGVERDIWHQADINKTLFNNYWANWIESIYNPDARVISYKGNLDYNVLKDIDLNSEIIIGNNKYNIEDMTVNLKDNSFEINLFPVFINRFIKPPQRVYPLNTNYTIGKIYDSVTVDIDGEWNVRKISNGDGTDWVKIDSVSNWGTADPITFNDRQKFTYYVEDNSTGTDSRSMTLRFIKVSTGTVYDVQVNQAYPEPTS